MRKPKKQGKIQDILFQVLVALRDVVSYGCVFADFQLLSDAGIATRFQRLEDEGRALGKSLGDERRRNVIFV